MSSEPEVQERASRELEYRMTLFIAGNETHSRTAQANLAALCESELQGRVAIEIVDVLDDFEAASKRGVLVTPTLLIHQAGSDLKIIGNLSDTEKLRAVLGLESS